MELKDFIQNSLISLVQGVKGANKYSNEQYKHNSFIVGPANDKDSGSVLFDVAVTAGEESGKAGGGNLKIAIVNIGGEKNSKVIQESVSRIKFYVKFDKFVC